MREKKGQSLAETALIIAMLGLVLIGMQVYVKRGVQGRVKDLTDNIIGEDQAPYQQDTSGLQVNTMNSSLSLDSSENITVSQGGARSLAGNETTTYTYDSIANSTN